MKKEATPPLDAYIIDEIKRREREKEQQRENDRPRQELPVPPRPPRDEDDEKKDNDRGVVIIDQEGNVERDDENNKGNGVGEVVIQMKK